MAYRRCSRTELEGKFYFDCYCPFGALAQYYYGTHRLMPWWACRMISWVLCVAWWGTFDEELGRMGISKQDKHSPTDCVITWLGLALDTPD